MTGTRARRDPEGRRRAITAAARAIIAEEGVPAVTHRRVAARAGVPLGATTQYFASLDALIAAAVDELAADYDEDLARLRGELAASSEPSRTAARFILGYLADAERARAETAFFLAALHAPVARATTERWGAAQTAALAPSLGRLGARMTTTLSLGIFVEAAEGHAAPSEDELAEAIRLLSSGE